MLQSLNLIEFFEKLFNCFDPVLVGVFRAGNRFGEGCSCQD